MFGDVVTCMYMKIFNTNGYTD